jgi:hypothetical protein
MQKCLRELDCMMKENMINLEMILIIISIAETEIKRMLLKME